MYTGKINMNVSQSMCWLFVLTGLVFVGSCRDMEPADSAVVYDCRVVNRFPHDPDAFTQGLVFDSGLIYEGTGLNGRSSIRKVGLSSGAILQSRKLSDEYFGEGITIFGDRIIQLTWQSQVGFVYDKESFKLLRQFNYEGEGWGITHDGKSLIISDGSAKLRFLAPHTFEQTGILEVFDEAGPVLDLNELEFIKGQIYANVWETTKIAIISPETGQVAAWIDLENIYKPTGRNAEASIPNGIAYDGENDRIFVTGKLWPGIFEIKPVDSKK